LPSAFENFRKSKTAPIFGIVLASLVSLFLLLYGAPVLICFQPIVIALVAYFVPWYFGFKNRKWLAVFGLVLFLALGIILGYFYYAQVTGPQPTSVSTSNDPQTLTNGTISLVAGSTYHYAVDLRGGNGTDIIWVETFDYLTGAAGERHNLTLVSTAGNTSIYATNVTFSSDSAYYYYFSHQDPSGSVITTGYAFGPVMVSNDFVLQTELQYAILNVFLDIGLLFYLLLVLTWWMDSSKKKYAAQMEKQKAAVESKQKGGQGKAEKFVCSECGTEVPADAKVCPQCGERFDDEDKRPEKLASGEVICSECGKTVKETDERCWNCGKKFEN
jgi:RNA polymerase subunit RPABC4/transcription elongation factor Spt4